MIQIRKATADDAQSLAELNQAFNGVSRPTDEIRRALQISGSTETVLVAEESGTLVGFACVQTLHSVCYGSPRSFALRCGIHSSLCSMRDLNPFRINCKSSSVKPRGACIIWW